MTPVEDVVFAPGLHAWQCICGHVNDLRSAAETTCDACGSTEVAGSGGTCVVTAVDRGAGVVTLGSLPTETRAAVERDMAFWGTGQVRFERIEPRDGNGIHPVWFLDRDELRLRYMSPEQGQRWLGRTFADGRRRCGR